MESMNRISHNKMAGLIRAHPTVIDESELVEGSRPISILLNSGEVGVVGILLKRVVPLL